STFIFSYTLSLHDALPIYENASIKSNELLAPYHDRMPLPMLYTSLILRRMRWRNVSAAAPLGALAFTGDLSYARRCRHGKPFSPDRKSTRLNSSHVSISYA